VVARYKLVTRTTTFELTSLSATDYDFTANFKYHGEGSTTFNPIKISGEGENKVATCDVVYSKIANDRLSESFDLPSGDNVSIICHRKKNAETQKFDPRSPESYIEYPSGVILVSTSIEGVTIPLTSITHQPNPVTRIKVLEQELAAAKGKIEELRQSIVTNNKEANEGIKKVQDQLTNHRVEVRQDPDNMPLTGFADSPTHCGPGSVAGVWMGKAHSDLKLLCSSIVLQK
jgi:hypothetical protein